MILLLHMELVSIKVDQEKLDEIKLFYHDYLLDNDGEYIYFLAKKGDIIITGYSSNKTNKTVTFKGDEALKEARLFDQSAEIKENKVKEEKHFVDYQDQIGSDEVGVGDFLLPIIVVAAYVKESQMKILKEYKIADSKTLTDQRIREIGPKIVKEFIFSKLTLSNEKYNKVILSGENLNSVKAKMHNKALYNLHKEYPDVFAIYVDQFVNEKTYYKYLKDEKDIVKEISFKTKGESLFPCVALASVIARYSFLLEKDKLENKYHMVFPCGASSKVDKFAKEFKEKYGQEELDHICKQNFKNYKLI